MLSAMVRAIFSGKAVVGERHVEGFKKMMPNRDLHQVRVPLQIVLSTVVSGVETVFGEIIGYRPRVSRNADSRAAPEPGGLVRPLCCNCGRDYTRYTTS